MPEESMTLPQEAQDLPEGAQNVFKAAFQSAQKDGLSQEAATKVAWNTINQHYEKGEDGNWNYVTEYEPVSKKSTQSTGN